MLLLLSILALAAAKPDPAGLFDSNIIPEPEGRVPDEVTVQHLLRESGVTTVEEGLGASLAKSHCLASAMCRHGANTKISNSQAVNIAISTFTAFLNAVRETQEAEAGTTKNIDKMMGAVKVGSALGLEACDNLYRCGAGRASEVTSRSAICDNSGAVCPGLAMGCSMCGIFNPVLCSPMCTYAAFFCGVGGYACAGAPPTTTVAPVTTTATTAAPAVTTTVASTTVTTTVATTTAASSTTTTVASTTASGRVVPRK